MVAKTKTVFVASGTTAAVIIYATMIFLLLITIVPIKGYAALCGEPNKSTTYFSGYEAAQEDFHSGHGENQALKNSSNQDYKQGYKDGWNDAQYNVNVLEHSIC
jgi:hypothetical protein